MADGDIFSLDDPNGTELFAIDTSGNVSVAGTLSVTGAVTLSSTLGVTGLLTASAGVDCDGNLDLDHALTAAGDGANVAVTVNHATAAAEGIDVSIAQLTTPRTAGRVAGVKSKVTSLSGDTAAVVYTAFEASATVGEANANHVVVYSEDAFDFFLVAAADGDAGAVIGAMTAKSPETDAEAGYIKMQVAGTTYEIPFYAVA